MAETQATTHIARTGRVGNFLVKEEVIDTENGEPLHRLHITDCENAWEVVIPQTFASAYGIIATALDTETLSAEMKNALHFVMDNFFIVTTCMDGAFHTLVRDIAAIGLTPAVSKDAVRQRKALRKAVGDRLRAFEFPHPTPLTEEEERHDEIRAEMEDV